MGDKNGTWRTQLRLPAEFKAVVEELQGKHEVDGLSLNAVLVVLIKRGIVASPELRQKVTEGDDKLKEDGTA